MISFSVSGSFDKTARFLQKLQNLNIDKIVLAQAEAGVAALANATPRDSALASSSWDYVITKTTKKITITWTNSNDENGYPVAVMIQYGHGTGTGGYVQGIDYINPAMRPVFDKIADTVWKAVKS